MTKFVPLMLMALSFAGTAMAMPVEDITLKNVTPKEGELDINLRSLNQITLTFSQDIEVGENKKATLTLPTGEELTAKMVRNRFMANTVTLNYEDFIPLNGTYTLTIKRWSVGDAEWIENDESGHSNPQIEVEWTISNGLEAGVDYDLNPVSISPVNNATISYANGGQTLSKVQIVMPKGAIMNPASEIHLSCTEARYEQKLTFMAAEGTEKITYTANVSPAPTISGDYTLLIPGGSFGDADFIAGEGGHANPPITYLYSVTGNMSEEGELLGGVDYSALPTSFELEREGENYTASMTVASTMRFAENKGADCALLDEYGYAVSDINLTVNTDTPNTAQITFAAPLDEEKSYTLVIPQGLFGTAAWVESKFTDGQANPQLTEVFTPSKVTTSVKKIEATESSRPNDIYTSTGILLHRDATEAQIRALTPGLYIIAGKKVMVK